MLRWWDRKKLESVIESPIESPIEVVREYFPDDGILSETNESRHEEVDNISDVDDNEVENEVTEMELLRARNDEKALNKILKFEKKAFILVERKKDKKWYKAQLRNKKGFHLTRLLH